MTKYEVSAWCSVPHYTVFEVDAGSVDEALMKAKSQAKDEYGEQCDGAECEWDEFVIVSEPDAAERLVYLEPSRLAENAAPELLGQLRTGIDRAQSVVNVWERGDLAAAVRALAQWLPEACATVNEATGKPEQDDAPFGEIHFDTDDASLKSSHAPEA